MYATLRRVALLTVLVGIGYQATPDLATALPHLGLSKSSPMKDSTVISPTAIKLWFTEKPSVALSKISLTGPNGVAVVLGKPVLDTTAKLHLAAAVTGTLAPGAYKVKWSTASDDGHAVADSFSFKVKAK